MVSVNRILCKVVEKFVLISDNCIQSSETDLWTQKWFGKFQKNLYFLFLFKFFPHKSAKYIILLYIIIFLLISWLASPQLLSQCHSLEFIVCCFWMIIFFNRLDLVAYFKSRKTCRNRELSSVSSVFNKHNTHIWSKQRAQKPQV